jgi:hypothetical protein
VNFTSLCCVAPRAPTTTAGDDYCQLVLSFALMYSNMSSSEELRMRQQTVVVLKVRFERGQQLITAALRGGALRTLMSMNAAER